jgi:hypothetical protein
MSSPPALSRAQKAGLLTIAALLIASLLMHNHPSMDGLHDQLKAKAPTLFKLFVLGEGVYFLGMILMTLGLGASLGPNPLTWTGKLRELMAAPAPNLARARLFWLGFLANAAGSTTFAVLGIYVALRILPGGTWTLGLAASIDLGFSLLVRLAFYRRFTRSAVP